MNYLQAIQLALQILSAAETVKATKPQFKTGDASLYIATREFCKRLELRNKGIAQLTGYSQSVSEIL